LGFFVFNHEYLGLCYVLMTSDSYPTFHRLVFFKTQRDNTQIFILCTLGFCLGISKLTECTAECHDSQLPTNTGKQVTLVRLKGTTPRILGQISVEKKSFDSPLDEYIHLLSFVNFNVLVMMAK